MINQLVNSNNMAISKYLYKYLPIARITYLQDELLRFTQPADLNDPFECYPKKIDEKKLFETLEIMMSDWELVNQSVSETKREQVRDQINEKVPNFLLDAYLKANELIGIFSLSKNWNNSLMWAHYAQSHTGFCVGFDFSHEFFKDFFDEHSDKSQYTRGVKYSNDRSEIKVDYPHERPDIEIFLTKSKDWKYEQEIRVIKTLNQRNKEEYNNDGLKIHLFKVPHSAIREIIIGAKTEQKLKQTIIEFCKNNKVQLYQSIISDITFDMEREEISIANYI